MVVHFCRDEGRPTFEEFAQRLVALRIHLFILVSGSGLSWSLPAPFLQCDPALTPRLGSGVLAGPLRIDEEFQKYLVS